MRKRDPKVGTEKSQKAQIEDFILMKIQEIL